MATFRKYGGTNFSPISNIVRHNIFNSKSSSFNTSGLYNSKETYLSHIDMSGNSLLHVGNIYFQDGTVLDTATGLTPPTLASVLNEGNVASKDINMNNFSINNISQIQFQGGKTQNTSYTGWQPLVDTSYNSATLTFDINGKITNVIDNSFSPFGLEAVLTKSGDGGGKSMTNLGDITQASNKIITQSGTGTNTLNATQFGGDITQASNKIITQLAGTGTNTLNSTTFSNNCKYLNGYDDSTTDPYSIPDKQYVDNIASGIKPTGLCKCATTGDVSLSSIMGSFIVDSYNVQNGDRVLVKSQGASAGSNISTTNISNGIYVYNYDTSGSLNRADDCLPPEDVTNQLTFISDGSLNGMKAFVQDISGAVVGTNGLRYIPFYSLNYSLGQGLELVGGAKLQVKSELNFLNELTINRDTSTNGYLILNSTYEPPNGISIIYQDKNLLTFDNNSDTSLSYYDSNFKFACNNLGDDYKQTIPLQFNSSLFTIDMSNNSAGGSIVKYQACNNSHYSTYSPPIPIGHSFYGNVFLKTSGSYLEFPDNSTQNTAFGTIINTSLLSDIRMYSNIFTPLSNGSMNLTQGIWLITFNIDYSVYSSPVTIQTMKCGISTNSTSITEDDGICYLYLYSGNSWPTGTIQTLNLSIIKTINSTTSYYLVGNVTFTTGSTGTVYFNSSFHNYTPSFKALKLSN